MPITVMLGDLSRNWMWVALRGLVATLFGLFALIWPGVTLAALVIIWGAYAIADGACALIAAFQVRDQGKPFWSLTIVGVLGIGAGVIAFVWPAMTAFVLLVFIAAWAFAMGLFQIAAAIRLRKEIENEWLLGLSGALSLVFGVLMLSWPAEGALAMIWIIGAYALFFGVLLIVLGFRLRGYADRLPLQT